MVKRFAWYQEAGEHKVPKTCPQNPTKLKHGIQAGQVLVILAGKFRGKRTIFLKQLGSGNLLVTGPFKVNGVPLLRVPQKLTLTTSKKISVEGVKFADITDAYFTKEKGKAGSKEEQFFQDGKKVVRAIPYYGNLTCP